MGVLYDYLRRHPWQRRVLTLLVAVSVSGLAAVIAYPYVRNDALRRNLGSEDEAVRRGAIREARLLMSVNDSVRRFLETVTAGAGCDDRTFLAATTALLNENAPNVSARPVEQADRFRALMLEQSPLAMTRRGYAWQLLIGGRVNEHTRRAAARASADEDASVRAVASALAAKVGDESSLRTLLADADPNVVALAALDAGLTGRTALAGDIEAALEARWKRALFREFSQEDNLSAPVTSTPAARPAEFDDDLEVISNAAFALARLAPREHSGPLSLLFSNTRDPMLHARLLYVMPMLDRDEALDAVRRALENSPYRPERASAMLAGAQLGLHAETERAVRKVFSAVLTDAGASVELLRAACQASLVLKLNVGDDVYGLLEDLWDSRDVPLRNLLVQLLAAHARQLQAMPPPAEDLMETPPVTRAECVAMLTFIAQPWSEGGAVHLADSVPAAVAAFELLKLDHPDAWDYVKEAAASSPLAAFELACRMARDANPAAHRELILSMLPDPRQPTEDEWTFETNVKVAAAVWMGLATRGVDDPLHQPSRQRILLRYGTVRDPYLRQTYDGALLAMGQHDLAAAVRRAFVSETKWVESDMLFGPDGRFPQFLPVYGALLVTSGDRHPLDWLLASDSLNLATQAFLLQGMGMHHVVRLDQTLPTVDPASSGDLHLWQVNILRHAYLLRGAGVPPAVDGEGGVTFSNVQAHGAHNAGGTPASRGQP